VTAGSTGFSGVRAAGLSGVVVVGGGSAGAALLALGGAGVGVPAGAMDGPSTAAAAGATTVPQPHELTTEVPHMYDVPQQETGV